MSLSDLGISQEDLEKAVKEIIGSSESSDVSTKQLRRKVEEKLKLAENALEPHTEAIQTVAESIQPKLKEEKNGKEKESASAAKGEDKVKGDQEADEDNKKRKGESASKESAKRKPKKRKAESEEEPEPEEEEEEEEAEPAESEEEYQEDDSEEEERKRKKRREQAAKREKKKRVEHPKDPEKTKRINDLKKIFRQAMIRVPKGLASRSQEEQISMLKEELKSCGLSANASKKEIAEVRKRREQEQDTEGLDARNIIGSANTGRRTRGKKIQFKFDVDLGSDAEGMDEEEPQEESSEAEAGGEGEED